MLETIPGKNECTYRQQNDIGSELECCRIYISSRCKIDYSQSGGQKPKNWLTIVKIHGRTR